LRRHGRDGAVTVAGMDRRLGGIMVLFVALVAVIVVPSIAGRRVPGSVVATVFPLPPAAGDCLLAPFPVAVRSGVPSEIPFPATRFGSCEGSIAGEVVAVWPTADAAEAAATSRRAGPCYQAAATFAGLESTRRSTDLPDAPADGTIRWKPTIGFDAYHVVPGDQERKAGRSWVACLAVPTGRPTYRGTLTDAFTTGSLPAEFGLCWEGDDIDRLPGPVPCTQPHAAELLATGFIRDRLAAPTEFIDAACPAMASRLMRTDDPTRGGQLRIVSDRSTGDVFSRSDAPLTIGCMVVSAGPQRLSGTVIGLGDRPAPLVG
jgi:hypothetical protein